MRKERLVLGPTSCTPSFSSSTCFKPSAKSRVLKVAEVGIETSCAAALILDEPVERDGHPNDYVGH
jgi:hypothetical protein